MPRDGSGVYTLPAGNPVVTNTVIASSWANNTMTDIAAQLNNVFTRDGLLGPTGPFKVVDGTVAAPGLAWNSEPGLGWYRSGAGIRRFASAGGNVESLNAAAGNATFFALNPRTNGTSSISLNNDATTAPNRNTLTLQQNADGTASVMGILSGTATAKTLGVSGFADVNFSMTVSANQLFVNPTSENFYLGMDANHKYLSFAPQWFWNYERSTGQLNWNRSPGNPATTFSPNGDFHGGRDIYTNNNGGLALINSSVGNPYLRFTTDGWKLIWNSGNLFYQHPDGTTQATFAATGDVSARTGVYAQTQVGVGTGGGVSLFKPTQLIFNAYEVPSGSTQQAGITATPAGMTQQLEFRHSPGVFADIFMGVGTSFFTFDSNGNAVKSSGAGSWNGPSDVRIKENIMALPYGLDEVLQLNPVTYQFTRRGEYDTSLKVGLIAQEAMVAMPMMVYTTPDERFEDGLYGVYPDYVQYALVNAVKTLHARIAALEAA